jgi:hypothetical protein
MKVIMLEGFYADSETHELLTGEFMIPGGSTAHLVNGVVHRPIKEGPALIDIMGAKHYIVNGKVDRVVYPWQTEPEKPKYTKIVIGNKVIEKQNPGVGDDTHLAEAYREPTSKPTGHGDW